MKYELAHTGTQQKIASKFMLIAENAAIWTGDKLHEKAGFCVAGGGGAYRVCGHAVWEWSTT